jgi:hypothetical protein
MSLPQLLTDRNAYHERLRQILPASVTGTTATANDAAAAAAFVFMYVGAVDRRNAVRPTTIIWMSDAIASHRSDEERAAYHTAAMRSEHAVKQLCKQWEIAHAPWYATNSREQLRDETIRAWIDNGAVLIGSDVGTTSPSARYTFAPGFAALFAPGLDGDTLTTAIVEWQRHHLTPTGRARATRARQTAQSQAGLAVKLPGGGTRLLHTGKASLILKGVIEEFTASLSDPAVVFISQSGEKVNVVDGALLEHLGLSVDVQRLLPDCLIADLAEDRDELWFIEVVYSDGPITEERRAAFVTWATRHGLREAQCRFLTAFESRTSRIFKNRLPLIARGTFVWFLDEPDGLLAWGDLPSR